MDKDDLIQTGVIAFFIAAIFKLFDFISLIFRISYGWSLSTLGIRLADGLTTLFIWVVCFFILGYYPKLIHFEDKEFIEFFKTLFKGGLISFLIISFLALLLHIKFGSQILNNLTVS